MTKKSSTEPQDLTDQRVGAFAKLSWRDVVAVVGFALNVLRFVVHIVHGKS